jgi:hypothetical protein
VQRLLIDYFLQCLDALEVRQGQCHGELRLTERGPALIGAARAALGAEPAIEPS